MGGVAEDEAGAAAPLAGEARGGATRDEDTAPPLRMPRGGVPKDEGEAAAPLPRTPRGSGAKAESAAASPDTEREAKGRAAEELRLGPAPWTGGGAGAEPRDEA